MNSGSVLRVNAATSVGRASLLLAGLIFVARLAGFGRNVLTSYFYGTGIEAEAFNAAYAVPEVISIVVAGGALATGFVPTFSGLLAHDNHDGARHTFRALLTLLFVLLLILTGVLIALSYTPLLNLIVPPGVPDALYAQNLRLLLVAQAFFILGGVFTGAFNSLRWFWLPALAPVFLNVGIIVFGWIGAVNEWGIVWQSYGAIFGAIFGSFVVQVPFARAVGLDLRPKWDLSDEGVRKVLSALVPIFFGLASGRLLTLSLPVMLALDATAMTNASRVAILPLELIASGSAIAVFPTLSQLAASGELEQVRAELSRVVRRVLKLLAVATVGLILVAIPLVQLPFAIGEFSAAAVRLTAQLLILCALALPALGVQQLLARGFYALDDTKTPTWAGVGAFVVFGVLVAVSRLLNWGTHGVMAAATISVSLLALVLWVALTKRLGRL